MTASAATPAPTSPPTSHRRAPRLPGWRAEELRTTFWLAPLVVVMVALAVFAVTITTDLEAFHHHVTLPFWTRTGTANAGREVLIAIAASVITTVGVVFSITILALTLASQQFGPRMMRQFIRDRGNQMTLGIFVGTFVYAVLTLGFITVTAHGTFVPHLSITVSEALLLVDLGVLVYFIHHIATSIQLPRVISKIAADLFLAIEVEFPRERPMEPDRAGRSLEELNAIVDERGAEVAATSDGYLQYVSFAELVKIASRHDAVIRLAHRPGHFVLAGRPLAKVWPSEAAPTIKKALEGSHLTGPHRTLSQDPVFAVDQLVEIAIRALSPAVNDTFTALTCIDWLSAGLARVSGRHFTEGVYRDEGGDIRLIGRRPSYDRMVHRSFDKVRQAGRGMPAVEIRLLEAIARVVEFTVSTAERAVLLGQAEMVMVAARKDIDEPGDLAVIERRYGEVLAMAARKGAAAPTM